jgi:hypothetical protein
MKQTARFVELKNNLAHGKQSKCHVEGGRDLKKIKNSPLWKRLKTCNLIQLIPLYFMSVHLNNITPGTWRLPKEVHIMCAVRNNSDNLLTAAFNKMQFMTNAINALITRM